MVTVSIVLYRTPPGEVDAILSQVLSDGAVCQCYLIDHSPCDQLKYACLADDRVTYVHNPLNPGYGAGHNSAMQRSAEVRAKYHAVINSDLIIRKNVFSEMSEFMDCNEDIGVIGPKLVDEQGQFQYSRKMLPTPLDMFLRATGLSAFFPDFLKRYELHCISEDVQLDVAYLSGAFLFFNRRHLDYVGGFDEQFFMYPEDIDISRRFATESRCVYVPEFRVTHHHRAESKKKARMFLIHAVNMSKYFNKWGWIFDPERKYLNRLVAMKGISQEA